MKLLNPLVHGSLDYMLAALFLLLPSVLDFSDTAATVSYVIGVLYVGTSVLTRYPLGLIRVLPFPIHGVLETLMALSWMLLPWLFGFADDAAARNFFLIAAVALLGVVALTDYRNAGTRRPQVID